MQIQKLSVSSITLLAVGFLALSGIVGAQKEALGLKIDDVMTAQELKDSGVSGLTVSQRKALNAWLNRYTENIVNVVNQNSKGTTSRPSVRTDCVPAIESTIAGDFNGWEGETIFKLDNGQIWEQAEYDYTYSYSYRPDVTIYSTSGGCRMKVEDEDETILVRRIR
jgi:hypothetical protein